MNAPLRRLHHIPELLEIHADELAYLWGQRRAALSDDRYTLRTFIELNERIEAHVAGLLTVPSALPGLLGKRLQTADDRDDAFAAACGLLRLQNPQLTARIVETFATAEGPRLLGLRDALGASPLGHAGPTVQALLPIGEPVRAVAAATVLAQRGLLSPLDPDLTRLLLDDDAEVAHQAWRVLTQLDFRANSTPDGAPPRPYKSALLRFQEPATRRAVLGCAVWTAQPWLLRGLRQWTSEGDVAALQWLAAVGEPEDDALLFETIAAVLPPLQQPRLLARCGRPAAMPLLVDWMHGTDQPLAAAARDAYTRITGEDLRGPRVTPKPPPGADAFEQEMTPSVWLPDLAKLKAHQDAHRETLAAGQRWNRGREVGPADGQVVHDDVDLPARWDACARAALAGRAIAPPPPAL